jgi:rSAM/selenodomain-associated transferase 2
MPFPKVPFSLCVILSMQRNREMISVIIPAFNEEDNLNRCIESIISGGTGCEIIIADGASMDKTVEIARAYEGVKTILGRRGRGSQMNRGAASALGDILLFLHADTYLERGWDREIISSLGDGSIVGGAFAFRIDSGRRPYRLIEYWVKFRCRVFHLPYGDQGIFVRRDVFDKLGGYKEIPLMEDVDFVERMKKIGAIRVLKKKALTHARKWEQEGWFRRSFFNQVIMMLYRLGASPEKLARLYYR